MYIQVKMEALPMATPPSQLDLHGAAYCASFNFRRTARAVTRFFDLAFQQSGIRSTQFTILVGIAKTQPTSISSLANLLVIDPTTLTRSLRLLAKERLVEISKRSTMRQRFVTLATAGEKALARSLPAWRAAQERWVQAVGSEHWLELRAELERLASLAVQLGGPQREGHVQPVAK
jgi:MarR family transcriptional regulator, organic hydroperoxide resistance regulator